MIDSNHAPIMIQPCPDHDHDHAHDHWQVNKIMDSGAQGWEAEEHTMKVLRVRPRLAFATNPMSPMCSLEHPATAGISGWHHWFYWWH